MKYKQLIMVTVAFLLFLPFQTLGQLTRPVMGTTENFVLFTSSGALTNTGASQLTLLTGDVGSNYTDIQTNLGNIDGSFYTTGDGVTAQAAADLVVLYNELYGLSQDYALATLLGGPDHFPPGVYANNAVTSLDGNLILDADGDPDALFIFVIKAPGTFSSTANSSIELINGAQACNVFWLVEGTVGIATGNTMKGTFVSAAAISFAAETEFEGRALTKVGAININNSETGFLAQKPIGCGSPVLTGPAAPNLGTAGDFALFTGNGSMANSGVSTIVGDVGSNTASPTGFDEPTTVDGTVHAIPNDETAQANIDLGNAYNDLNTLSHDIELIEPTLFGHGLILTPQTYLLDAATTLTGDLYLDAQGNPDAVFVIKVNGAFNTAVDSKVLLINGAKAENVYWHVVGAVTIEGGTFFEGTSISTGAVDIKVATELNGRALTKTGGFSIVASTAISVIHTWDGVGPWNTVGNWSTGDLPGPNAHVLVNTGDLQIDQDVTVGKMTVNSDAVLTIESVGTLTVNGTLTNNAGTTGLILKSDATGNGSLIVNGTVAGNTTVQSYVTAGQWHGISAPVSGIESGDLMIGGTDVYLLKHDEPSNLYSYVTSTTQSLGTMGGFFIWIDGSANTYSFAGNLNTGTLSTDVTAGGAGYNFIGNPWSSAIDWEAATGWGGTSIVADNVWVYTGSAFTVYNRNTHVGGGSRYIAMNQGFFVEATTAGTLTATNDVCVHNGVPFRSSEGSDQKVITLELSDNDQSDKTFIVFKEGATTDYEGTFDAHKLFSFNEDYPQIYSTANEFMAINSLPYNYRESIAMDVRGENGNEMTISATETADIDVIYLQDEATGIIVDLTEESYTFTYDSGITDRFTILFGVTSINENPDTFDAKLFASNGAINVMLSEFENVDINVFNLLGQNVASQSATGTHSRINVQQSGYYLVKLSNGTKIFNQKVYIR